MLEPANEMIDEDTVRNFKILTSNGQEGFEHRQMKIAEKKKEKSRENG